MKKVQTEDAFIKKRIYRQKQIRKRRMKIFFAVFTVVLLMTAAVLSLTVFFPVENIEASGSLVYSDVEILAELEAYKQSNLFTVSAKSMEDTLKSRLPYIDSITVKRKLPGTIVVTACDADKYLCYLVDGKYYTVSQSGWVMEETESEPDNLTVVSGLIADCKVGSEISIAEVDIKLLIEEINSALASTSITAQSIDVSDSLNLTLFVENRFLVELGTSNNLTQKIKHLGGMINSISKEKSGKIDLSMWEEYNMQGTFKENAQD